MNTSVTTTSSSHLGYLRFGLLWTALVFGGFGAFAYMAPLDSAAIATARVSAESSTKPLQHLEGGIVREILVKESSNVKAGQTLFRLDPTQATASVDMLQKQIDAATALETRLKAERDMQPAMVIPASLEARRSVAETAAAIADQTQQFAERRRTLISQIQILKSRVEQSTHEIDGLTREEHALTQQQQSLSAEIANVTGLAEKGFYPRNKLMALQREQLRFEGQIGSLRADIARKHDMIEEARIEMVKAEQSYREEASGKLSEVRARIAELREKLKVAADVMARMEIRAPQDGVIQGIKVHAAGAVVKPGEIVAELVPTGDKLVLSSRVSPLDIESVGPGQTAEVRFASFAARRLPIILGTVESVSADTMYDEITRQPYYAAKVVVEPASLPAEIADRLLPGMPADVMIATGERTLVDYLTGPLTTLFKTSMREK